EILAMPRNEAWVFVRGMRPMRLTMVDYGRVAPWRDEVAANPLEGSALRGEPAFSIRYGEKDSGVKPAIEGVKYPPSKAAAKKQGIIMPIRLRHLLWLPPMLAFWSIAPLDAPLP